MLKAKDIPDEMIGRIREAFDRDPQVCELRTHQNLLQRSGQFREAMEVAARIDYLYTKVVQSYIYETEKECQSITLDKSGLPETDIEQLNECVVTLFMACDIIDTAIMDANDIIHRTDKELHFEMFDGLNKLSKMVRDKMRFLSENSGYAKEAIWADKCDNMYELLRNKARSVIRKRKQNKDEK